MPHLTRTIRAQLMEILDGMAVLDTSAGRTLLLQDLPVALQQTIARSNTKIIDIASILDASDRWDLERASSQDNPLQIVIENAAALVKGTSTANKLKAILHTLQTPRNLPAIVPPIITPNTTQSSLPVPEDAEAIRAAFAQFFATLDEISNPELLDKARQLRTALAQDEPDLAFIIELRRYFAARPGKARAAANIFFNTPAVRQLITASTEHEYGGT